MVTEAHDTHHPVRAGLYYEDQKAEALRCAKEFCSARMPKFLRWFESILVRNPGGSRLTCETNGGVRIAPQEFAGGPMEGAGGASWSVSAR